MAALQAKKRFLALRLLIQQCGILTSLLLQLHSFIYMCVACKRNFNEKLITYYATRRNILGRKVRHLKMRKSSGKRRAAWVINGRTETWLLNMITGDSPDHEWRKNFRMTGEKFCILCERLRPYFLTVKTPNYRYLSLEER